MSARAVPPAATFGNLWWWLPRASFLLFLAAIAALLWFIHDSEREEQRSKLISDMLWLEQNLRFVLIHNEDILARFDPARMARREDFEAHAGTLLDSQTGIVQVLWLDAEGALRHWLRPPAERSPLPAGMTAPPAPPLPESAGRITYGAPYALAGDEWLFDVRVPIHRAGAHVGTAVAVYSIRRLLGDAVPWWLTERYQIAIVDGAGNVLGQRTRIAEIDHDAHYQLPFDPPGYGLLLRASPYRLATSLPNRLIAVGLTLLALLVLISLWTLRRHVQGRLAAETALQNEVAFRKAMEDSVQTGLRARTLDGEITYVNPAFCKMVGWTAAELVGRRPPMPYWAEEYMDETRAMHARVLAGQAPSAGFEIKLKRRNGEIFDALIIEAPLIDAQGRHTGWMGSVVDITERKRSEELARQQEARLQASARLITMGEMASSLAHELNQPLSAISSYLAGSRNLIAAGAAQAEIDEALAKCQDQAQRAGRILRRIYDFARRHEPRREPCDLNHLLNDLIALVEAEARRQKIRIVRNIAPDLPSLSADGILLGQAILNLMKNGIEAMAQTPEADRLLEVHARHEAGQVHLTIADRGCGISAESAELLFEPFYTTKTEGLGVGLNICRSVVEAHHGRLWFAPVAGGGTAFHICLPVTLP